MERGRPLAGRGLLSCAVAAAVAACSANADERTVSEGAPHSTFEDVPPNARDTGAADAGEVRDAAAERSDAGVELRAFHVVGRYDGRDPLGPRVGWPGAEIRATFTGSELSVELAGSGVTHLDVSIDGAPPTPLVVTGERAVTAIAAGLAPGVHEVALTKRTETLLGTTQLVGFVPGAALVPSPPPTGRRIEFVGDSITCGFGVLGADETCAFSADTEVEPLAWGALAARELGALRAVVAFSGLGVLRNYGGETTGTMPERYGLALADDPTSAWDHSLFAPDVVVVALGTNDFAGGKGDPGPPFGAAYEAFLGTLRAVHPSARIVAATSPMLSGRNRKALTAYITAAIAARNAAGDAKLSLLELDEQSESDGYGCGYHPSVVTHEKLAAKLVAHLKVVMGW